MGWPWPFSARNDDNRPSSNPDLVRDDLRPSAPSAAKADYSLTDEQRQRIFGKPAPSQAAPISRDNQADAELEDFLKSLETSHDAPTTTVGGVALPNPAHAEAQAPQEHGERRILPGGSLDISHDALLPRTMSCRQSFDQAFYCQSLGGKFNDVYRYGHIKSCSDHWGAFWFCARTRTLPAKEKERQIQEYYRTRDEKRRKELGSSEDVWQIRDAAVKRAFWRDPDEDEEGHGVLVKE